MLGLYQGAAFLDDQLNSFVAQDHARWRLVASDDGSTDGTSLILRRFARHHGDRQIKIVNGPRMGFARNFLSLLSHVPQSAEYVAFSDQDDVWHPQKLSRAVAALRHVPAMTPAMYCAGTLTSDGSLAPIGRSKANDKAASFQNSLIESISGGNTILLNKLAVALLARCAAAADPVSHDLWVYQIITGCGGQVIHDRAPVLLYRQHDQNVVGSNVGFSAKYTRLKALLAGQLKVSLDKGLPALATAKPWMTADALNALNHFSKARKGRLPARLWHLLRSGVHRQNRLETCMLWLACVLNRI